MIAGVGTDILKISQIAVSVFDSQDPFVRKTYTPRELELICSRPIPLNCYATRFAGKEAVFKCLGIAGDAVRLNEIEILEHTTGQPYVVLHGNALRVKQEKGIGEIFISLSYDTDYAVAFAVSEAARHE